MGVPLCLGRRCDGGARRGGSRVATTQRRAAAAARRWPGPLGAESWPRVGSPLLLPMLQQQRVAVAGTRGGPPALRHALVAVGSDGFLMVLSPAPASGGHSLPRPAAGTATRRRDRCVGLLWPTADRAAAAPTDVDSWGRALCVPASRRAGVPLLYMWPVPPFLFSTSLVFSMVARVPLLVSRDVSPALSASSARCASRGRPCSAGVDITRVGRPRGPVVATAPRGGAQACRSTGACRVAPVLRHRSLARGRPPPPLRREEKGRPCDARTAGNIGPLPPRTGDARSIYEYTDGRIGPA